MRECGLKFSQGRITKRLGLVRTLINYHLTKMPIMANLTHNLQISGLFAFVSNILLLFDGEKPVRRLNQVFHQNDKVQRSLNFQKVLLIHASQVSHL